MQKTKRFIEDVLSNFTLGYPAIVSKNRENKPETETYAILRRIDNLMGSPIELIIYIDGSHIIEEYQYLIAETGVVTLSYISDENVLRDTYSDEVIYLDDIKLEPTTLFKDDMVRTLRRYHYEISDINDILSKFNETYRASIENEHMFSLDAYGAVQEYPTTYIRVLLKKDKTCAYTLKLSQLTDKGIYLHTGKVESEAVSEELATALNNYTNKLNTEIHKFRYNKKNLSK